MFINMVNSNMGNNMGSKVVSTGVTVEDKFSQLGNAPKA